MKIYIAKLPIFFAATFLASSFSWGQPTTKPPAGAVSIPQRNLAVCFLFSPSVPELYFKDPSGQFKPLQITSTDLSAWNTIPATKSLDVYIRKIIPETQKTDPITQKVIIERQRDTYEPRQQWTLPEGTSNVRQIFYFDRTGRVKSHTYEPKPSPLGAQVTNISDVDVAMLFGPKNQVIRANSSVNVGNVVASPNEPFPFRYAIQLNDGIKGSSLKKLRFSDPKQSLTILIGYSPTIDYSNESPRTTGYSIEVLRLFEDSSAFPEPPPPYILGPDQTRRSVSD